MSAYWVGLLTQVVILGILAMSLDLLIGYTGLPSLGHAGFFGVAAYGVGILSTTYQAGSGRLSPGASSPAPASPRCSGSSSRTCATSTS